MSVSSIGPYDQMMAFVIAGKDMRDRRLVLVPVGEQMLAPDGLVTERDDGTMLLAHQAGVITLARN